VIAEGWVSVVSGDCSRRVDGKRRSACGTQERYIEGGEGTAGGQYEAVKNAVCVLIVPHDCSRLVEGESLGSREDQGEVQAINCSQGAVGGPNEAVIAAVCVKIVSRDFPRQVDGQRLGGLGGYGDLLGIEAGEAAVGGPHETVTDVEWLSDESVDSRDYPRQVAGIRRNICGTRERYDIGEFAAGGQNEAVRAPGHKVGTGDCSRRGDVMGLGVATAPEIERGKLSVGGPHEAVSDSALVSVVSHDCSRLVDGLRLGE